jgi:uncharacterized membrane protein
LSLNRLAVSILFSCEVFMNKSFKKVSVLIPYLFLSLPLFAQGLPPGMQGLADTILGIFTGGFIKVVLAIFLCGSAVAYAFNKDNEKIKRNCIAIAIASGIIIGASSIVGAVWAASGG